MPYNTILFDLDGTLTDSGLGVIKSIKYALSQFDIHENDLNKLLLFIGSGLEESFRSIYSFSADKARQAVDYYREYFAARGIYENDVYTGIPELLDDLFEYECRMAVATLKPKIFADRVLRYFEIDGYFERVIAPSLAETEIDKTEIIARALEIISPHNLTRTVMIGDRKHDINGAQTAGIDSIAVTYGYGDLQELQKAGATHLVESVEDLKKLLIR